MAQKISQGPRRRVPVASMEMSSQPLAEGACCQKGYDMALRFPKTHHGLLPYTYGHPDQVTSEALQYSPELSVPGRCIPLDSEYRKSFWGAMQPPSRPQSSNFDTFPALANHNTVYNTRYLAKLEGDCVEMPPTHHRMAYWNNFNTESVVSAAL
ncbi:hypothetical protein TWF192_011266 [Orbilia oligospora]|uniref:Uncharacterized protein n=1 Tax=Orbilia oligospora TaxID=2813651 RepID=A0A6G1LX02_ORBOL|nr:hypothetical protein TWF191_008712 [Orbilia oligospora]KAF3236944.1 hypothetical protein TWF192_011266 [Orbilia oligospora]